MFLFLTVLDSPNEDVGLRGREGGKQNFKKGPKRMAVF